MANDAKTRLLDGAWDGLVFTLSGEEVDAAFPGGFEEASHWCGENGMTLAANGEDGWTVERTPVPS